MMLKPIEYEEYHRIYEDHLMRDVDILSAIRIVEVEHFDESHLWYLCDKPAELQLSQLATGKPIRSILIT